ncbi:MAG: extracellular solute-binding protein [Catenulispora sp.]|nr:extracellular solute-binding protein [Catenulispora sp.]
MAAALIAAASLSGCSSGSSGSSPRAADAAAAKSFTYWSMWKESEPQATAIKKALAGYQAATGVTVTVQWHGRTVLDDVAAAVKAGKPAPDLSDGSIDTIFGAVAGGVPVNDLTQVYQEPLPGENQKLADVVPDKYLPLLADSNGAVVMIPYEVASEAIFYDKAKEPQLVANPPRTWDDFVKALDAVKAKGQAPLALDPSPDNCAYWVEWMFEREVGPGQFKHTAEERDPTHVDGASRWDDSRLLDGAQKLEALIKGGYFAPGYATEDTGENSAHATDQQNAWTQGKAALLLGGTWTPGATKRGDDVDSFVFPSMPDIGGIRADNSVGVSFFGFALPKAGKNTAAAEKFVLYFMAKDRLGAISSEAGDMTPRIDIAAPQALASVQLALTNRTVFSDQDALMRDDSKWYTTVFQKNAVDFMTGKLTAAQFIRRLRGESTIFWQGVPAAN